MSTDTSYPLFESTTHSFIVKVWLEEQAEEANPAIWRGHITHVLSGNRQYIDSIEDVLGFMAPYFQEMGAKLT